MSNKPPLAHKKGITLSRNVQYQHSSKQINGSTIRSFRSTSRSRGVSISRSSGISIDKIYEPKHFNTEGKSGDGREMHNQTLNTNKSFKLLGHEQTEQNLKKNKDQQNEFEKIGQKQNASQIQKDKGELRARSPISKLDFGSSPKKRLPPSSESKSLSKQLVKF